MGLKLGKAAQLWTPADIVHYNIASVALNSALNSDKGRIEQVDHLLNAAEAINMLAQSILDVVKAGL